MSSGPRDGLHSSILQIIVLLYSVQFVRFVSIDFPRQTKEMRKKSSFFDILLRSYFEEVGHSHVSKQPTDLAEFAK